MPSTWIARLPRKSGGVSFRVFFRVGGRESVPRHGGSFRTQREALLRKRWIDGEFASLRVPDLRLLAPETTAETVRSGITRTVTARARTVHTRVHTPSPEKLD
jgi:hypothetical protein